MSEANTMTHDEIIDMARSLGICELTSKPKQSIHYSLTIHTMEAFAKLVDAKATARVRKETLEEMIYAHPTTAIKQAVEYEREACAKVCEDASVPHPDEIHTDAQWSALYLATAIRNRGDL